MANRTGPGGDGGGEGGVHASHGAEAGREPASEAPPEAPPGAPNVLYVLLDGVGLGWCDAFGGLVETPNIAGLARGGLAFMNFHTTALRSTTRACLLTGRNHRAAERTDPARPPTDRAAIAAMLREHGYASFAVGTWHDEDRGASALDRWPTGPLFGFDRFYGFVGGDPHARLFLGREPVEPPAHACHPAEDLVDRTLEFLAEHRAAAPERPWLCHLAFDASDAPERVGPEWIARYRGRFDMGWDRYRDVVLARQKARGIVPAHTALAPMPEDVPSWRRLPLATRQLYARRAEVQAGLLAHADAQIGRLLGLLESTGELENTLVCLIVGGEGAPVPEDREPAGPHDRLPVGWALAGSTPFRPCEQPTRVGGTRNPMVLHWPRGIAARGELRAQFHHVTDVVPTILQAIGVGLPRELDGVLQAPLEGVPMNYTFDEPDAPTWHPTQYFEALGHRAIVDGAWKAVAFHGRRPWENDAPWSFDDDHWELYDLEADPGECHDLMAERSAKDVDDPVVQKLVELVALWWAEADRYGVLAPGDRSKARSHARLGGDEARGEIDPG